MWNYWHIHPEVLIGLTLLQIGCLLFIGPLRKRFSFAHDVDPTNIFLFTLWIIVLFISLLSPLHVLGDKYLSVVLPKVKVNTKKLIEKETANLTV